MAELTDDLRRERLDNGMQVLLKPVTAAPLVSVWCWYHVGSKDEPAGLTGISHFVEHMNFKGTSGISREELKVWIERAGGAWNGYTWIDQTTYFETMAAEELDLALRIESERMSDCLYDPGEFEHERTVVLSELQGNRNSPEYQLDVEVTAAALRAHPYRWPTIGWESDLEGMTRDDLFDWYRTHYVPANASLVVVGDITVDAALDAVNRHFGDKNGGAPTRRRRVREPDQDGERRVVLERPGTASYLHVAYHAPAFADEDFVPMLVADAILTGGKGINLYSGGFGRNARTTSPLYQSLVETELTRLVSSAILPTEEPYLYGFGATLREGIEHRAVEEALFASIDDVGGSEVPDRQLRKAKNQVLSSIAFEAESVTQIAHQLGYYTTIATVDEAALVPERVEAVQAADVQRVLARYLAPERRTIGWFVPRERDGG